MGIPAPAQRKKPSGRGGVGSFYADSAVTLHSSHWQLLTIQAHPSSSPSPQFAIPLALISLL